MSVLNEPFTTIVYFISVRGEYLEILLDDSSYGSGGSLRESLIEI